MYVRGLNLHTVRMSDTKTTSMGCGIVKAMFSSCFEQNKKQNFAVMLQIASNMILRPDVIGGEASITNKIKLHQTD